MYEEPYTHPRWNRVSKVVELQCNSCTHYKGFGKCDAYPDKIPAELLNSKVKHTKPFYGDNGIRYNRDPDYVSINDFIVE